MHPEIFLNYYDMNHATLEHRTWLFYLKIFILLIICYVAFGYISCLLPHNPIKKNIQASTEELFNYHDYPHVVMYERPYLLDNFTDALVIQGAYNLNGKHPFKTMLAYPFFTDGHEMTYCLDQVVNHQVEPNLSYVRYWHGSTFFLRFCFLFSNYNGIRYFFYLITSIAFLLLGCLLYRQAGLIKAIGFCSGFFLLNFFMMQFSIQFLTSTLLALSFGIVMTYKWRDFRKVLFYFFLFGSLTAYFDLFSMPILVLGTGMVIYLLMLQQDMQNISFINGGLRIVYTSLLWGGSYAITWAAKLLLSTLFTPVNAFADAYYQAKFRAGAAGFDRWDAITANATLLNWKFIVVIMAILLLFAIFFFNKKGVKSAGLLTLTATFPYIWYLFAANHSYLHCWFAYRLQSVTISALLIALITLVQWDKVGNIFHKSKITAARIKD